MSGRRLGVGAAIVDGTLVTGDVIVDSSLVAAVGVSPSAAGGRIAVAGFVDLQVNGFAGVDFTNADEPGWADALLALARTGVTALAPTMPTARPDRYAGRAGHGGSRPCRTTSGCPRARGAPRGPVPVG